MIRCPHCGTDLPAQPGPCPTCGRPVKPPFTIRGFLWEYFRLFTMVGITGTMISLIPNMGERVLGAAWITEPGSFLPLLLSVIIFFGAIFMTICFVMIFGFMFRDREEEAVRHEVLRSSRPFLRWYAGDTERLILLFCLVPMWLGLTLFFTLLMPLIPNNFSSVFATITVLACIPLALYAFFGWKIGKTVARRFPRVAKHPRLTVALVTIVVIACLVFVPFLISAEIESTRPYPGDIGIRADQEYFSPHVSSAKGIRLTFTNMSGVDLIESTSTWSADYGYFIRVIPSTSQVTILGNPVTVAATDDVYWTWSSGEPAGNGKPVEIRARIYRQEDNRDVANPSLYLTWYRSDIVQVNGSTGSSR